MKGYSDLADLPEDERIQIIGAYAMEGNIVAFAVDSDPSLVTARRYFTKLKKQFPGIRHIDTSLGPPGVAIVRVGPEAKH